MNKKPPYQITSTILSKIELIGRELGVLEIPYNKQGQIRLRRENKIRTIHSSLEIEGNTLSLDEVSRIFEGKKIIGPHKDIIEVENAIKVYTDLGTWSGASEESFLKAHGVMMQGLVSGAGQWRKQGVAVYTGDQVAHMAPPAGWVSELMNSLFEYITNSDDPWLIKACVFHYELEFIHPFNDGNGRMGRLWQQVLLMKHASIFEFVPVEEIIKQYQIEYYEVLRACDQKSESTLFIEFCLDKIVLALKEMPKLESLRLSYNDRIVMAKEVFKIGQFSRKDYVSLVKVSTATASRDLHKAVAEGILDIEGDKATARYSYSL